MKFDLEGIEADPRIYILKLEPRLIVPLFVDDRLATYFSPTRLEDLVHHMEKHFGITRSNADLNIEFHILCLQSNGHLFIHQAIYLRRILSRLGFSEWTPLRELADLNTKLDNGGESFLPPFL